MRIDLSVNGQTHALDVDGDTPLLLVLRNHLGLTAAKLGCGLEQCGACAVIVDGNSTLSCARPVSEFSGRSIRTAEGLINQPLGQRLSRALTHQGAGQCGYCMPGIFVALGALFEADPDPDHAAVVDALQPHLCRCGSQARVLRAAQLMRAVGVSNP